MVDGKEYRLTKEDCLKIQGFNPDFKLCGNNKDQWKQLGNTIPTIFTEIMIQHPTFVKMKVPMSS